MAMTLRLTDEDSEALRECALREGRSMQEVALSAVREYVTARQQRIDAIVERIRTEDAELLDRLSR